ncbi:hypothetical protein [Paraburkholderia tropica]|uniref:hypothetical protein n=1 Tax=Paraburkholderia tropica TaxID=92647 RepID=UPI0021A9E702|nr:MULTISPECIES: hypothetical protein [Paraburkholderia]
MAIAGALGEQAGHDAVRVIEFVLVAPVEPGDVEGLSCGSRAVCIAIFDRRIGRTGRRALRGHFAAMRMSSFWTIDKKPAARA